MAINKRFLKEKNSWLNFFGSGGLILTSPSPIVRGSGREIETEQKRPVKGVEKKNREELRVGEQNESSVKAHGLLSVEKSDLHVAPSDMWIFWWYFDLPGRQTVCSLHCVVFKFFWVWLASKQPRNLILVISLGDWTPSKTKLSRWLCSLNSPYAWRHFTVLPEPKK